MKRFLLLLCAALLCSCGEKEVVQWGALSDLDNLSILVENAAFEHDHKVQKELLNEAKAIIEKVSTSIPTNVNNREQVKVLLKDLGSLTAEINKLETLDHNRLDGLSKSIHPIVAKLMKTAGVPHVHSGINDGHDPSTCSDPTHNH